MNEVQQALEEKEKQEEEKEDEQFGENVVEEYDDKDEAVDVGWGCRA